MMNEREVQNGSPVNNTIGHFQIFLTGLKIVNNQSICLKIYKG